MNKKINYIIVAHNNKKQLFNLIETLNVDNNEIFIHLDLKFKIQKSEFEQYKNVYLVPNRISVKWGGASILRAIIETVKFALENGNGERFVLLSGACFPIKNQHDIKKKLFDDDCCYIDSTPMDMSLKKIYQRRRTYFMGSSDRFRYKYFDIPKNKMNLKKIIVFMVEEIIALFYKKKNDRQLYYGGTWWALPKDAILFVIEKYNNDKDFTKNVLTSFLPDEFYFQTILSNSIFKSRIRKTVTYTQWIHGNKHPELMSDKHIDIINNSSSNKDHYLFARKFNFDQEFLNKIKNKLW
ncbi:beta-1,6-N-acetylglucosaminyltransferase [Flammeovirga sp. MY04]|uniref:beta-1,6-N-acetylglucosaminyltransferase n=1 Tax=Flammeovirga sp. MY04 TaxID=1191459 RepID=UPI0008064132|nr:beta-1,6-N-acetylglucosaminyltransferase [Flammeovirga sp. MY04]ANQ50230.1 beta-1,6-N-acetylglucosaminyltransferase [Flammeovirga sp. MY04]